MNKFLGKIPKWLSSRVSIFIYIFLFAYLVIFAVICFVIPGMSDMGPSSDVQLILGNYTNVLSALGASIAAGSGVAIHSRVKKMHENHENLRRSVDELHSKLDKLVGEQHTADKF